MQTYELYSLSEWLQKHLGQVMGKFNVLSRIIDHNATQHQLQPLEESLNDLVGYLNDMDLDILTHQQISLLEVFGIERLLGHKGAAFVDGVIRKSNFDPVTAHQDLKKASDKLQSAHQRTQSFIEAFEGIDFPFEDSKVGEGRVLLRVEFVGDAAMNNVADWKSWTSTWYEIVRGVALAIDERPEDTNVIGATQGSVIIKLAATYAFTRVLALISKSIASIARDYVEVRLAMEDLKSKKLINKAAEQALKNNAEEIKASGVARIVSEVRPYLAGDFNGEQENALKNSVEKALDFYNKGGDVDFVAPEKVTRADQKKALLTTSLLK